MYVNMYVCIYLYVYSCMYAYVYVCIMCMYMFVCAPCENVCIYAILVHWWSSFIPDTNHLWKMERNKLSPLYMVTCQLQFSLLIMWH